MSKLIWLINIILIEIKENIEKKILVPRHGKIEAL